MDYLLNEQNDDADEDQQMHDRLLRDLDEYTYRDDATSIANESLFLNKDKEDDDNLFNDPLWKDFMDGNRARDQMLDKIGEQIQQVKRITQHNVNEIEIEDEFEPGKFKTIRINSNAIQQQQIDELKKKVEVEQKAKLQELEEQCET